MNFCSGGIVEGTISSTPSASVAAAAPTAAPASNDPPRPPGIPAHYVFDHEVELWMPPSAVAKSAELEAKRQQEKTGVMTITSTNNPALEITAGSTSSLHSMTIKHSSNDPICFEFINSGVCGRLQRGENCRYRHLPADHPDVIADRVRSGKLPPSALGSLASATTTTAPTVGAMPPQVLAPGQTESDLPDPGPSVSLCFDFVNSGVCTRVRSGQFCRYRHLPPSHPDVIADRIRSGKMLVFTLQSLATLLGFATTVYLLAACAV